jgi:nickel transport protein
MRISLSLALLLASASVASAHASWITERAGEWAVVHGEGSTDEAYDPAKVTGVTGRDAAGNPVAVTITPGDRNAVLAPAAEVSVLTATWDEGWWTEDSAGEWHNAPPDGFADFKATFDYTTWVVSYVGPTSAPAPVGHRFEIVPLADPGKMAMGDKLPVQVLLDGQSLEGVALTNDILTDWDISSAVTDAEGKTQIIVANNGLNVAQVYHEIPTGDRAVEGLQAVLSFTTGLGTDE